MDKTTLCYIEDNGRYLMLHRIKKNNDANRDKWIGVGGHFEGDETPEECVLREVREETGLILNSVRLRGIIEFESDKWAAEEMYLFTADSFSGELAECNEGQLEWVEKDRLIDLNLWEGDYIFLRLLEERDDLFRLRLLYREFGVPEAILLGAWLDGKPLELFDVCDAEGNPTGRVRERGVTHRYGTWHRTSHVWIVREGINGAPELLLQKRSEEKDSFPRCYDISSAGHIPAGCDHLESALRELSEELGIEAKACDLEYVGKVTVQVEREFRGQPFRDHEVSAVYLYRKPVNIGELRLQTEEVESVRWMDLQECIHAVEEQTMLTCINPEELRLLESTLGKNVREKNMIWNTGGKNA